MTDSQDPTNPVSFDNDSSQTVNTAYSTVDTEPKMRVEEFSINGDTLLSKIQDLIKQGNVRRIVVKTQDGKTLFEIPLTAGIIGGAVSTLMFPFVTAIAAVAVLAVKLTIVIERTDL